MRARREVRLSTAGTLLANHTAKRRTCTTTTVVCGIFLDEVVCHQTTLLMAEVRYLHAWVSGDQKPSGTEYQMMNKELAASQTSDLCLWVPITTLLVDQAIRCFDRDSRFNAVATAGIPRNQPRDCFSRLSL